MSICIVNSSIISELLLEAVALGVFFVFKGGESIVPLSLGMRKIAASITAAIMPPPMAIGIFLLCIAYGSRDGVVAGFGDERMRIVGLANGGASPFSIASKSSTNLS